MKTKIYLEYRFPGLSIDTPWEFSSQRDSIKEAKEIMIELKKSNPAKQYRVVMVVDETEK